jgi:hypothetical protein
VEATVSHRCSQQQQSLDGFLSNQVEVAQQQSQLLLGALERLGAGGRYFGIPGKDNNMECLTVPMERERGGDFRNTFFLCVCVWCVSKCVPSSPCEEGGST